MKSGIDRRKSGGGGTFLWEANGDVPLDGVAFSRLVVFSKELPGWGLTFPDFLG